VVSAGDRFVDVQATIPRHPQWRLLVVFEAVPGLPVVEVHVFPEDHEVIDGARRVRSVPPGGLRPGRILRDLPVADVRELTLTQLRIDRTGKLLLSVLYGIDPADLRSASRRVRGGREDSYYAKVAARYVDLASAGHRNVVERLADELGVSTVAARDQLVEARRRELLISPGQRRVGGTLTPRAIELLQGGSAHDEGKATR
jgi:hypothetical protein